MAVVLVMFKADGTRKEFPVQKSPLVIGRKNNCDLRVPLPSISRKHCQIVVEGDSARVEDLGSSNGTYRNNEAVQAADLVAGDVITLGPVAFTVVIDGQPADVAQTPTILANSDNEKTGVHPALDAPGESTKDASSPHGDASNDGSSGQKNEVAELAPVDAVDAEADVDAPNMPSAIVPPSATPPPLPGRSPAKPVSVESGHGGPSDDAADDGLPMTLDLVEPSLHDEEPPRSASSGLDALAQDWDSENKPS